MGFVLPPVRIQDNMRCSPTPMWCGSRRSWPARAWCAPPWCWRWIPAAACPISPASPPRAQLRPAGHVDRAALRDEANFRGCTVVDPPSVVTTHLTELVQQNMAELLSFAETQKLLDELPREHQKLVGELDPAQIPVGGVQRVLQGCWPSACPSATCRPFWRASRKPVPAGARHSGAGGPRAHPPGPAAERRPPGRAATCR